MVQSPTRTLESLFEAGGWVMWPLALLSVLALALAFERLLFWARTARPGRERWLRRLADDLRAGDEAAARRSLADDDSVYARVARDLLDRGVSDHSASELIETHRRPLERFSSLMSTIITAAPLLGILGTVTGIIESFRLLGGSQQSGASSLAADPALVASGISEALVTTAFGLIIAMLMLFPFTLSRAAADRALGRLEALAAAASHGLGERASRGAAHEKTPRTGSSAASSSAAASERRERASASPVR